MQYPPIIPTEALQEKANLSVVIQFQGQGSYHTWGEQSEIVHYKAFCQLAKVKAHCLRMLTSHVSNPSIPTLFAQSLQACGKLSETITKKQAVPNRGHIEQSFAHDGANWQQNV